MLALAANTVNRRRTFARALSATRDGQHLVDEQDERQRLTSCT
jgi:hypothetical protein